jgi:3-isopropylmalate/(R)-2-methylmalate dehydratase small subunit
MSIEPFVTVEGPAVPYDQSNVDTDQLLPARFIRQPRSVGYGKFLFHDLRFRKDGSERPEFVLNQPAWRAARILVAQHNFGCGSSREQAPWGLLDFGIRCVIAASFGEIFYNNSLKVGLLPVQLELAVCDRLRAQLHAAPGATVGVDLPGQLVTGPDGSSYPFAIDAFRKLCLVQGLDEIGVTLQHEAAMSAFEEAYRQKFHWLFTH